MKNTIIMLKDVRTGEWGYPTVGNPIMHNRVMKHILDTEQREYNPLHANPNDFEVHYLGTIDETGKLEAAPAPTYQFTLDQLRTKK